MTIFPHGIASGVVIILASQPRVLAPAPVRIFVLDLIRPKGNSCGNCNNDKDNGQNQLPVHRRILLYYVFYAGEMCHLIPAIHIVTLIYIMKTFM